MSLCSADNIFGTICEIGHAVLGEMLFRNNGNVDGRRTADIARRPLWSSSCSGEHNIIAWTSS